jgi:O-antigen/teichoic acid export membrane protein
MSNPSKSNQSGNFFTWNKYESKIKFAFLYYSNYLLSGITSLVAARLLGPVERGMFAKYLLLFFAFQLAAERGLNGAILHFSAKEQSFSTSLRRALLRDMGRNSLVFLSLLFFLNLFCNLIPSRVLLTLWVSHFVILMLTIDLPILQGININKWSRINMIQPVFYAVLIYLFSIFQLTALTAVLAVNLSYIPQGIAAHMVLKKNWIPSKVKHVGIPKELQNFAKKNLIWTLTSTIFARVDVLLISFLFSNYILGMYSTSIGWILLCSPILNSFSIRKFAELSSKASFTRADFEREFLFSLILTGALAFLLSLLGKYTLAKVLGESFSQIGHFLFPAAVVVVGKLISNALAQISRSSGAPLNAAKWEIASIVLISLIGILWRGFGLNESIGFMLTMGGTIWVLVYFQYRNVLKGIVQS